MNPFRTVFERLEEVRAGSIARKVRRSIEPGWTVLDLGAGSLIVAEAVARATGARVFGLDRIAFPKRPVPLALYADGRAPFADASFDAVLVACVLHHCEDGGRRVLAEARRLARRRLIVLEDAFDTALERTTIRVLDPLLNRLEDRRIPVPGRFRPTAEWLAAFAGLGLRPVKVRRVRTTPILRTAQVLFVLEAAETAAGRPAEVAHGG